MEGMSNTLGIHLYSSVSVFSVDHLRCHLNQTTSLLKRVTSKHSGLTKQDRVHLLQAFVVSRIVYTCEVTDSFQHKCGYMTMKGLPSSCRAEKEEAASHTKGSRGLRGGHKRRAEDASREQRRTPGGVDIAGSRCATSKLKTGTSSGDLDPSLRGVRLAP